MGVKFNNNDIADIKVGTSQIESVYLGSDLVWSGEPWISGLAVDKSITSYMDKPIIYSEMNAEGLYPFIIRKPEIINARIYSLSNVKVIYPTKLVSNNWKTLYACIANSGKFEDIDTSLWDLSNITVFSSAFNASGVKTYHRTDWDISKATSIRGMFNDSKNLEDSIKLIGGVNLTECFGVFKNCNKITLIDLSEFTICKAISTDTMFASCSNLESITGLSNLLATSSQWTNANQMFSGCAKLELPSSINLPLTNCTNTSNMFNSCKGLTNITVSGDKSTSVMSMFADCSNLVTADISNFDLYNVGLAVDMFYNCQNLESIGTGTVTLDLSSATTTQSMFYNCQKLASNIKLVGGSNNTTTANMFIGCKNLENIDLNNYNISNKCTNISSMFQDCKLNPNFEFVLSGKDLSGMTNMSSLFSRRGLPTIKKCDLSNNTWREEGVNCNFIFRWGYCEYVDFRGLKPNSMAMCFYQAVYKTIDLRGCDTSLCTNMSTNFSIINTPAEHFYIDSNYFNTNIAVIPLGGVLGTNIESITSVLNSLIDHPKTKLENWDSEDDYDNWLYSQTLQILQSTFDFIQNNETLKALFDEATNVGWEISS